MSCALSVLPLYYRTGASLESETGNHCCENWWLCAAYLAFLVAFTTIVVERRIYKRNDERVEIDLICTRRLGLGQNLPYSKPSTYVVGDLTMVRFRCLLKRSHYLSATNATGVAETNYWGQI
jgi:hypothetical protein